MEQNEIVDLIKRELPVLMQENEEVHAFIVMLFRKHFADRHETDKRFEQLLNELKQDREEQSKKWAQQDRSGISNMKR